MNTQESIEIIIKNIDDLGAYALGVDTLLAQGILGLRNQVNGLKEQLDEPSREECEVVAVSEDEIECQNCKHIFSNEIFTFDEEYEFPGDGFKFCKVNYCPNCGSKIKKESL